MQAARLISSLALDEHADRAVGVLGDDGFDSEHLDISVVALLHPAGAAAAMLDGRRAGRLGEGGLGLVDEHLDAANQ